MAQTKSSAPVNLQSAYILHTRPYRDTSLLVEAFSHEYGRVGLVARGVRTAKSRYAGLLQPFIPLYLSWQGQGELLAFRNAESAGQGFPLKGDRLFSGFYLNELLLRLLHRQDPHPALFTIYTETLSALCLEDGQENYLRRFERNLLQELGYGLILDHQVDSGEVIRSEANYTYLLQRGPIRYDHHQGDGITISGKALQAIASDNYPDETTRLEAKKLMRAALAMHLGDKPLNSRELYRQQHSL